MPIFGSWYDDRRGAPGRYIDNGLPYDDVLTRYAEFVMCMTVHVEVVMACHVSMNDVGALAL